MAAILTAISKAYEDGRAMFVFICVLVIGVEKVHTLSWNTHYVRIRQRTIFQCCCQVLVKGTEN